MKHREENDVFFAIADSTRRDILGMLSNGNLALKDISNNFEITRTAVSKHLRILQAANLIESYKIGRNTIYQISPKPLMEVQEWLQTYSEFWDEKLNNLKNFVENNDF
ncbi:winged helix-turn-helix domain-containing protein [Clostridium sp. AL.422]|uniref:ArsR/SmtB family transcription factor n=1 Tax=Clostridium TaxID=1485 RepID=UPI00293DF993|nr:MULTISPECIES: winged helix-turn-helix domain-containing protein [unclassified Clostridium]MDV4150899.1 winged helix-turn-helix domain-containing protein [Clostridium sp. AL.422]